MQQNDKLSATTDIVTAALQQISARWSTRPSADTHHETADTSTEPDPTEDSKIIYCYVAGCRGLAAAARKHGGRSRYKIGTTTYRNLADRLIELGREHYAGAVKVGDAYRVEDGYGAWIALMIRTNREPKDRRITLLPRVLKVTLPDGMSRRCFDEALHRKLDRLSVNAAGHEPSRLTISYEGETPVPRRAREIYYVSPLEDGDVLLQAVEEIVQTSRPRKGCPKRQHLSR